MALPTDTTWEARSATGSDTLCSGGFSPATKGATGVDYSQQNAAQATFTATLSATGTTTLTDSANGFTNLMLGNLILINGQGTYCITTFVGVGSVTVDRALGTFSTITGYVGGAKATLDVGVFPLHVASNTIWAKGAFTPTGTVMTLLGSVSLFGYGTTRGDNLRATVDATGMTAANNGFAGGNFAQFGNLAVANAKAASFVGGINGSAFNCKASAGTGQGFSGFYVASYCESSGNANYGFQSCSSCVFCFSHGNTGGSGYGFFNVTAAAFCVSAANSQLGFNVGNNGFFLNCIAYGNGSHGFNLSSGFGFSLVNCVAYGQTGSGAGFNFGATTPVAHGFVRNCFAGSNAGGNIGGSVPLLDGTITILTALPFVDPVTTFDFTPNAVAGGGLALANLGWDSVAGLASSGTINPGVITAASGGGGSPLGAWFEG